MLPSQLSVSWLWLWAVCPQLHLDSVTAGSFDHVRSVTPRPRWHQAVTCLAWWLIEMMLYRCITFEKFIKTQRCYIQFSFFSYHNHLRTKHARVVTAEILFLCCSFLYCIFFWSHAYRNLNFSLIKTFI